MKQLQVLKTIASELNDNNIAWVLGASMMLFLRGLADNPKDIDIITVICDIEKADFVLSNSGQKHKGDESIQYSTRFFNEYTIDGVDIDLMAGFRINLTDLVFEYEFSDKSPVDIYDLDGVPVPLSNVEDWYLLYQLMPGRESKVLLIEEYLKENGVKYPTTLIDALDMSIPTHIKLRIKNLLI